MTGHETLEVGYKKISLLRHVFEKPERSYDRKIATLQNASL